MTESFAYTSIATGNLDFHSDALSVVAHNYNKNELYVRFISGGEYVYKDIPESVYNLLVNSPSLGRFYREHISGEFDSMRVYNVALVSAKPALSVVGGGEEDIASIPGGAAPESLPETKPSKFGVRWSNDVLTYEPAFSAVDEDDALDQFFTEVAKLRGSAFEPQKVKILAVIHYF